MAIDVFLAAILTIIVYLAPFATIGSSLKLNPIQLPAENYSCSSSVEGQDTAVLLQHWQAISTTVTGLMRAPQCGDGLWYRVAYLNMNDSTQQCPSNWMEISTPIRTCGRPTSTGASCPSEHFSTGSLQYSKVCGRAIGYQIGTTDSFDLRQSSNNGIDDPYVDGVSVTHGIPRTHIWTFAVGNSEGMVANYTYNCPCANPAALPPSFVGDSYFCESGNSGGAAVSETFFDSDPVWDGEQCEGECCSNGKFPPWFSVTLPNPTFDDIEVRICDDEGTQNEDNLIQLFEMFIQ